jgi:hypothetical protein
MVPIAFSPNDRATATHAPAVVTYAADGTGRSHVICGVSAGYGAAPGAGAYVQIEDGSGNVVFKQPITAAGPAPFLFGDRRQGSPNTALICTLSDGGAGVVGEIDVFGHYTTANAPGGGYTEYVGMGILDFSDPVNSQMLPILLWW